MAQTVNKICVQRFKRIVFKNHDNSLPTQQRFRFKFCVFFWREKSRRYLAVRILHNRLYVNLLASRTFIDSHPKQTQPQNAHTQTHTDRVSQNVPSGGTEKRVTRMKSAQQKKTIKVCLISLFKNKLAALYFLFSAVFVVVSHSISVCA